MMWRGGIVAIVAAALSGPVWAAEGKPAKSPPSEANWVAQPSSQDNAAMFRAAGVEQGRAAMLCKVEDDGALSGCQPYGATPGAAALATGLVGLAPKYRRKPPGPKDMREIIVVTSWYPFDKAADWVRKPRAEDILGVFPKAAMRTGTSGSAVITCIVTVQGAARDCLPIEEYPAEMGFGGAAVNLATQLSFRPAMHNGAPVESLIAIPIKWPEVPHATDFVGARRVITADLPWALAPAFSDVAAAYPPKAKAARLGGRAMVACNLTGAGQLDMCSVTGEEPKGQGFGSAAKSLTKQFEFPVATEEDRKAARLIEIHLPVTFDPAMLDVGAAVVGKPKWSRLPDGEVLRKAFLERKVPNGARATVECQVVLGGALSDCKVAAEDPAGSGAGAAVLSVVDAIRLTTWTAEGLPTIGGRVRIPLRYEPEAPVAPAK